MIWRQASGTEPGSQAEDVTARALRELPGVGLRNFTVISGRSVREVDCIVLTPQGIFVVETKGTDMRGHLSASLNGPWTVDGKEADFRPSANPLPQVRRQAQLLRSMLSDYRCDVGFVSGSVSIVGDAVQVPSVWVGDVAVAGAGELSDMLADAEGSLTLADALRVLSALDVHDIAEADLVAEGFSSTYASSEHASSRERRALRKREALAAKAEAVWRSSNRRRVIASGVGTVLSGAYLVFADNPVASATAVIAVLMALTVDLFRRANLEGARSRGAAAVVSWILTVGPFAGIGAVAGLVAATSFEYSVQAFLGLQIGLLLSLALLVTTLTGKSSFIFPPPAVVERTDHLGRPLGTFYLADATPKRGWWYRKIDQESE